MKVEAKKRASSLAGRLLRLVPRPAEKPELWLRPGADKVKAIRGLRGRRSSSCFRRATQSLITRS